MNKIITIGYLGLQNAYLNLDKEVAIERYCKSEEITRDEYEKHDSISYSETEFKDEFGCYEIWGI